MIAGASILGAVAVVVAAGFPLYVAPGGQTPSDADLVYVIGPPTPERVEVERALRAEGIGIHSLYSVGFEGPYTPDRLDVCREPSVTCVHPQPFTTKGEIAYLATFARDHDVRSTIILTFTPHVTRTRYIVARCYAGDATVVAVDQGLGVGDWIYQYAYQTAALVKAWLTPCADAADL